MSAASGEIIWSTPLPNFKDVKVTRRKGIIANYGPILGGGRLHVVSTDGQLRQFDPNNGRQLGALDIGAAAASAPIIVNGTLYLVTSDGKLRAFR